MTPQQVDAEIKQSGLTPEQYFRKAMIWKYGQHHDTYLDVLKYQVHGILPDYVTAFCSHQYHKARQEAHDDFADDILPILVTRNGD